MEPTEALVARLCDRTHAEPAAGFPRDRPAADHAGLYAWYASPAALELLPAPFDEQLPERIYAGQAGATSSKAGLNERQRCTAGFEETTCGAI